LVNAQTAAAVSLSLVYRIHVACGLGRGRRPAATRDHRAWHTHPGHLTFEPSWTLVCVRRVLTAPDGLRFGTADQTQRRAGGRESSHTAAPHTGFPCSLPCLIFRRIHVCKSRYCCGARFTVLRNVYGWPALGARRPRCRRAYPGAGRGAPGGRPAGADALTDGRDREPQPDPELDELTLSILLLFCQATFFPCSRVSAFCAACRPIFHVSRRAWRETEPTEAPCPGRHVPCPIASAFLRAREFAG
jgi:hypothetical protein